MHEQDCPNWFPLYPPGVPFNTPACHPTTTPGTYRLFQLWSVMDLYGALMLKSKVRQVR